ncbi:MAG: aldehyde dehydrogenase family protein [Candidatus Krumholzibacteriota bacterium]|nr:aldehyde dehydrogenase family protein [Candidatus Krumholzibacteriota bacterium]
MEKYCYVGGEWTQKGELFEVTTPGGRSVVGQALRPDEGEIERALEAAVMRFPLQKGMPAHEKEDILLGAAAGIRERSDEFTRTIIAETGKPIRYAAGEVERAIRTFTEAAQECSRLCGEMIPLDVTRPGEGRFGITGWFPAGPVLAITPFNFPLNLVAHKVAPAIAAGAPVIVKPSSEAPLAALLLAEVLEEAGLPPGGLSVLPMTGEQAGRLAARKEIKKVTFTGSADVGWNLWSSCAGKKITLELGGNAAVVLHEDWDDIDSAVERIVVGAYAFSGQVCISVQRILVSRSILGLFIDKFVKRTASLKRGDLFERETETGPMITVEEAERVESWIAEAAGAGARILAGGEREGAFYPPTVINGAAKGLKVVDEELFGPAAVVTGYDDFDEAIEMVNDSRFGLQAGVYTKDIGRIRSAFSRIETGGVIIGDVPTFRVDRMPYGGVKDSGTGKEGLRYAIREMCDMRLLVI